LFAIIHLAAAAASSAIGEGVSELGDGEKRGKSSEIGMPISEEKLRRSSLKVFVFIVSERV